MKTVVASIVLALGMVGIVATASQHYTLNSIETNEDVQTCVKVGGKAAMVADLDSAGMLASEWSPACLVPAKD